MGTKRHKAATPPGKSSSRKSKRVQIRRKKQLKQQVEEMDVDNTKSADPDLALKQTEDTPAVEAVPTSTENDFIGTVDDSTEGTNAIDSKPAAKKNPTHGQHTDDDHEVEVTKVVPGNKKKPQVQLAESAVKAPNRISDVSRRSKKSTSKKESQPDDSNRFAAFATQDDSDAASGQGLTDEDFDEDTFSNVLKLRDLVVEANDDRSLDDDSLDKEMRTTLRIMTAAKKREGNENALQELRDVKTMMDAPNWQYMDRINIVTDNDTFRHVLKLRDLVIDAHDDTSLGDESLDREMRETLKTMMTSKKYGDNKTVLQNLKDVKKMMDDPNQQYMERIKAVEDADDDELYCTPPQSDDDISNLSEDDNKKDADQDQEMAETTEDAPEEKPKQNLESTKRKLSYAEIASPDRKQAAAAASVEVKKPAKSKKTKTSTELTITGHFRKPKSEYADVRYSLRVFVPPSLTPMEDFSAIIKRILNAIQQTIHKNVGIRVWDDDFGNMTIMKPADVPSGKEEAHGRTFGNYFGSYVNPQSTKKSKKKTVEPEKQRTTYLKLRLTWHHAIKHESKPEQWGRMIQTTITRLSIPAIISNYPYCCQCVAWECVGWLLYSSKQVDQRSFIPAMRRLLKIPDTVACGVTWRGIKDQHGKPYPYDEDVPGPMALHLEVQDTSAGTVTPIAGELFKHRSTKRVNGCQFRLVPCFAGCTRDTIFDKRAEASVIAFALHQQAFVAQLQSQDSRWIASLDFPDPDYEKEYTLRTYLMSRTPGDRVTMRLFHNVDQHWLNPNLHTLTYIPAFGSMAKEAINIMVPECKYHHPNAYKHWFTNRALLAFDNADFDPEKKTVTSKTAMYLNSLAEEDLWGMTAELKAASEKEKAAEPDEPTKAAKKVEMTNLPPSLAQFQALPPADELRSMGSIFGRPRSDASIEEDKAAKPQPKPPKPTTIKIDTAGLDDIDENSELGSGSAGLSMNTGAKTTASTRMKLQLSQAKTAEVVQDHKRLQAAFDDSENEKRTMERKLEEMQKQIQALTTGTTDKEAATDTEVDGAGEGV